MVITLSFDEKHITKFSPLVSKFNLTKSGGNRNDEMPIA
jgi:hypothetical protein